MKSSSKKIALAISGLALSVTAGAGVAVADPFSAMADTTCSYDQAMAAVHAENPMAAQYLDQSPPNLQFLQTFINSPRPERISLLNQIKGNKGADQALPVFQQMLTSCTKY